MKILILEEMFDICKQCVNEEFQRTFIIFFMKKFAKRKQRKKYNHTWPQHRSLCRHGRL